MCEALGGVQKPSPFLVFFEARIIQKPRLSFPASPRTVHAVEIRLPWMGRTAKLEVLEEFHQMKGAF